MNRHDPLISIVTAVRNGAPYLRDLIESIVKQDYPRFEHIVIDDGSNDDGATVSILESYPHLRWWSQENKGQYATQNEGLAAARGDVITVISADDVYAAPTVLTDVVAYWQAHPECDIVYGKTLRMTEEGRRLPRQLDVTGAYPRWLLYHYLYVQHCSLFVARDPVVRQQIQFDPSLRYAGDWDWIIRLFNRSQKIGYIRKPLSVVRVHSRQASRTAQVGKVADEHRRVCRAYGGNYHVHSILHHLLNYRAMAFMSVQIAREEGLGRLVDQFSEWIHRKLWSEVRD